MKLVLLIARAAGIAALLSFGAAGCGLASSAHTQAFVSDGTLAAKAMTAQVSAAGGAAANLVNSADRSMCIDADSNHYPSNGDNIQLWACNTHPEQLWSITAAAQPDWAGSSFCAAYHVPYMGTTYKGVAACGVKYAGLTSNTQGKITHNGVMLDSVGFQCVERADPPLYG